MKTAFFTNNRTKFVDKMDDYSTAVFFSGKAPRETADQQYSFSVDRNFF